SLREQPRSNGRVPVCAATLGNVGAVLAQQVGAGLDAGSDPGWLPPAETGLVVGLASAQLATQVADAWQQAQTAMRFCGALGLGSVVAYEDLGSLATLAEVPPSSTRSDPDVRALAKLANTSRGRAMVETLEQRLTSGSVRGAAAVLYLHHS